MSRIDRTKQDEDVAERVMGGVRMARRPTPAARQALAAERTHGHDMDTYPGSLHDEGE